MCTKVHSKILKYGQQVCPFWSPHTNTLPIGSLETLISKQRIDFGSYHANHENKQTGPKVVVGSEIWSFLSYTPSFFILCNGKKELTKVLSMLYQTSWHVRHVILPKGTLEIRFWWTQAVWFQEKPSNEGTRWNP